MDSVWLIHNTQQLVHTTIRLGPDFVEDSSHSQDFQCVYTTGIDTLMLMNASGFLKEDVPLWEQLEWKWWKRLAAN